MSRPVVILAWLIAFNAVAAVHPLLPAKSLQAAIDAARDGDTIELAAGVWRENLVIEKSITLAGQGALKTAVELPGDIGPTFEAAFEKLLEATAKLPVAERQGFLRTNRLLRSSPPLRISGSNRVVLRGIALRWRGPQIRNPSVLETLVDIRRADVRLEDVAVLGSPDTAVHAHDGAALEMRDCLVAGNLGRGVAIGGDNAPVRRAHLVGCELRHNYLSHVATHYHASDVRIDACFLHGTAFFGVRANATNAAIVNNHFRAIPRTALYCSSPASLLVSNNLFVTRGAASFWHPGGDRFLNNTVVVTDGTGLFAINDANPRVVGNVFHGCATALQGSFSSAAKAGAPTGRFDLGGNWFSVNRTNYVRYAANGGLELPALAASVRHGDPGFIDAARGDYRLRSDGPARMAGMGATLNAAPRSRFPLQPEEQVVIPENGLWDFNHWRLPPKPDLDRFHERLVALLQPEATNRVTYHEAFRDLHATLGRRYPNFELKGIDWGAVGAELLPRAETVKDDREFAWLCYELGARLQDSHVTFSKGTIEPPRVPYPEWDPGFACLEDNWGRPVVYHVADGSSAARAGLAIGSVILEIDGRAAVDTILLTMEGLSRFQGYSSERFLRYHATRFFPRREKRGAEVKLRIEAPTGETRELTLSADTGGRYLPRLPVPTAGIEESANVSWTRLPGDIGLIHVRRIRGDLIERLDAAVGELGDVKGLIIDVRGNSGGGFDARRAHVNFAENRELDPERPRHTGPVALLIDERCISAGEGWASWFIARKRARVFGTATAGASARKTTYPLKNGLLRITFPVKPYRGFLDRAIERRGLEPDVIVRQTAADLAAGRDTVRDAAAAWLATIR